MEMTRKSNDGVEVERLPHMREIGVHTKLIKQVVIASRPNAWQQVSVSQVLGDVHYILVWPLLQ